MYEEPSSSNLPNVHYIPNTSRRYQLPLGDFRRSPRPMWICQCILYMESLTSDFLFVLAITRCLVEAWVNELKARPWQRSRATKIETRYENWKVSRARQSHDRHHTLRKILHKGLTAYTRRNCVYLLPQSRSFNSNPPNSTNWWFQQRADQTNRQQNV